MSRLISIIIPARSDKDDLTGLLADLARQKTDFQTEIIRVMGVAPVARARNNGAKQAKGDILVFIDCDIRLGNEFYVSNLAKFLEQDKGAGAVCASLRLPPDASVFQRKYVQQVAHYEYPIASEPTKVFVASSACFAMRKELFVSLGGFNERIIRGEDSELSHRLLKAGYRLMLAPKTWCYHPAPDNLAQLVRINLRNGDGVAFVDTFYPEFNIDVHPKAITEFSASKTRLQRLKRFSAALLGAFVGGKGLLILSKFFYAAGYAGGIFKYRILRFHNDQNTESLSDLKKILIIHLGGMGDILLSEPAIRALRKAYPSAETTLLVTSKVAPVVGALGLADRVFVFDMFYGGVVPFRKILGNMLTLMELKKMHFDAAINMRTLVSKASAAKMGFLFKIINPKMSVGRDTEHRGYFFDFKVFETDRGTQYEMDLDLETVKLLGVESFTRRPVLEVPQEDLKSADALLEKYGVVKSDPLITIHVGGMPSRRWPIENFAGLLMELARHCSAKIAVVAGPGEERLLARLQASVKNGWVNLGVSLSFLQLAALIKRSQCFVSNDTGPMHVAAVLKTPQVAIFGPGDMIRFDPRNISECARLVYKEYPCAPCNKKECDDMKCLKVLTVSDVLEAVLAQLPSKGRGLL
jgi:ADP-heptose:LPS heptosyltransferase